MSFEEVNDEVFEEITKVEHFSPGSLMVNVDYLELVEKYGEEESWVILGKLKDLLE